MAKVILDLEAKIKGLEQSLTKVEGKLKGVGDQSKKSTEKVNKSFASAQEKTRKFAAYFGATIGGAAVVGSIKKSIDAMKEFEQTFTNVLTLLSEADRKKFGGFLKEGSLDLMRKYGFAVQDVNKALFDSISAGVKAGDSIKFMNEAAKLATAGVTSLGVAVDGMTSIMNAYRLEAKDAEKVSAAFFTAQKFGKTTVEELSNNIGKLAPIAASAGVSFQEMLSALALLTSQGISTEESTTALRATITALINPSIDAAKTFKSLGIETGLVALRNNGLGATLLQVAKASEENADKLSEMIPNVRALTAVAALGEEALGDYDNILKEVETDYGTSSSMAKAFALQQDTVANALKRIGASIKTNLIDLGSAFGPLIKGLADIISPIEGSSKALQEEQVQLNSLVAVATSANISEEARRLTIEKIQNMYPDFLGNIETEKVDNDLLKTSLINLNSQYRERIKLSILQERLDSQEGKLKKRIAEEIRMIERKNELERLIAATKIIRDTQGGIAAATAQKQIIEYNVELLKINSTLGINSNSQEKWESSIEKTNNLISDQIDLMKEQGVIAEEEIITPEVTTDTGTPVAPVVALTEAEQKALDKSLEQIRLNNEKKLFEGDSFAQDMEDLTDKMFEQLIKDEEDYSDITQSIIDNDNEETLRKAKELADNLAEIERVKQAVREASWDSAFQLVDTFSMLNEAAMNKELAKVGDNEEKKEEIRKKYARKEQTMAVLRTIMAGAEGIVKTGANLGYPAAIPFQVIQGLQTLAQIALIKSQKFEKGGYEVLGGRRHSEGGTMIPIGEAERGEGHAVFSRWATQYYGGILPELVDSINKGRFPKVDMDISKNIEAKEKLMKFMHRITLDDSKQLEEIKNLLAKRQDTMSITTDRNGNSYMITKGAGYTKRMKLR